MAKQRIANKTRARKDSGKVQTPAASLELKLYAPGMSIMHRAGLGGLACTLKAMERDFADGHLDDHQLPGGPWAQAKGSQATLPWLIDQDRVVLHFAGGAAAAKYLKRLFAYAFQIQQNDGLIVLPGQYRQTPPRLEVLAELQAGLTLTFLQHGKTRALDKKETTLSYDPEETGIPSISISYKRCSSYKHQGGWEALVTKKGFLRQEPVEVIGPLNPGAVVRHNAFAGDTKLEEPPDRVLPLYFALVGSLALSINRGVGVLIVPDVDDLLSFVVARPLMTPRTTKECRITSAGDAALQAQVRVKSAETAGRVRAPACYAMTLQPTPWASQQKSRVSTMMVSVTDGRCLERFESALAELPPRIAQHRKTEGKRQSKKETIEYFWVDSVIRPLIADNLALERPWYAGFTRLMCALDSNNKPIRNKLVFEKKGLDAMTKEGWDSASEETVVRAVHEALRRRYGQIADENRSNPAAMKNRWKGEYDRWRLAFAGAKTEGQLRSALVDLWSRGGANEALQQDWRSVMPMLSGSGWQLTRDLALLALASYTGKGDKDLVEESRGN